MLTAETQNQLNIIKTLFKNNNIDINFLKVENTQFIKKISCWIDLVDIKTINKINSIKKTLVYLLNTNVIYYYDYIENILYFEIEKQKENTIFNFLNYFKPQQKYYNNNYIFLGLDAESKPIYKKLNDIKSLLIGGSSGWGKSNLLHNIILSYLILNKNSYIMMIDPKKTELTFYNKKYLNNKLVTEVATSYDEILKTILIFKNEITRRFDEMKKNKIRFSTEPPLLLIIDEFSNIPYKNNKEKNKINNLICETASIGRAANCYLIISTQHPTNENLKNNIRVNLQSKIALHCESNNQSYNILSCSDAVNLKNKGDFILKADDGTKIKLKSCLIHDSDIINILKA